MHKKTGRKSDTAAIKAMPMYNEDTASTSVRKIDNGYIVSKSVYDKENGYSFSERFSEVHPGQEGPKGSVGDESLKGAFECLKRG